MSFPSRKRTIQFIIFTIAIVGCLYNSAWALTGGVAALLTVALFDRRQSMRPEHSSNDALLRIQRYSLRPAVLLCFCGLLILWLNQGPSLTAVTIAVFLFGVMMILADELIPLASCYRLKGRNKHGVEFSFFLHLSGIAREPHFHWNRDGSTVLIHLVSEERNYLYVVAPERAFPVHELPSGHWVSGNHPSIRQATFLEDGYWLEKWWEELGFNPFGDEFPQGGEGSSNTSARFFFEHSIRKAQGFPFVEVITARDCRSRGEMLNAHYHYHRALMLVKGSGKLATLLRGQVSYRMMEIENHEIDEKKI